jgi:hypothetical protein
MGHRHGNALDQPRVLGWYWLACVVDGYLVAKEVEVDPGCGTAAFSAAQYLAIEPAGSGKITHEESEVEGLRHRVSMKRTLMYRNQGPLK